MGISDKYEEALSKAFLSSGISLPSKGSVLLSIADKDKQNTQKLINLINEKGYQIIATPGTARLINSLGVEAEVIEKRLDKNPNVLDMIRGSKVIAVVNTVTGDRKTLQDGFRIRREATERRLPCFTSLDTAYAVFSDNVLEENLEVNSLDEYLALWSYYWKPLPIQRFNIKFIK